MRVHAPRAAGGGRVQRRQLLFVDLAGSERIRKTGVEGDGRAQATSRRALALTVSFSVRRCRKLVNLAVDVVVGNRPLDPFLYSVKRYLVHTAQRLMHALRAYLGPSTAPCRRSAV